MGFYFQNPSTLDEGSFWQESYLDALSQHPPLTSKLKILPAYLGRPSQQVQFYQARFY